MSPHDKDVTGKEAPKPEQLSRDEEAFRLMLEQYVADLRAILKKLREKLN
jgi:hypothetical protein